MAKFNVGDSLLVVDCGRNYCLYEEAANELGIRDIWRSGRYADDHLTEGVSKVVVLSFMLAPNEGAIYGVVCEKGFGWVIGESGLAYPAPERVEEITWQSVLDARAAYDNAHADWLDKLSKFQVQEHHRTTKKGK